MQAMAVKTRQPQRRALSVHNCAIVRRICRNCNSNTPCMYHKAFLTAKKCADWHNRRSKSEGAY